MRNITSLSVNKQLGQAFVHSSTTDPNVVLQTFGALCEKLTGHKHLYVLGHAHEINFRVTNIALRWVAQGKLINTILANGAEESLLVPGSSYLAS